MVNPLTTPFKHPSAPLPPPFWPDHGIMSNFESINLLIMQSLNPVPKFDTMQAKWIYGLTMVHPISMNKKITLTTSVYSTFHKNPNYQSNPMILHKNWIHQFYSRAESPMLKCPLFKNLKLDQVSSTAKILRPFVIPCMKWVASKVQHKLNLTTVFPTV